MKISNLLLIKELIELTQTHIDWVQREVSILTHPQLLTKPVPGKWSIAECLEHLNSYGRYYLPAIGNALNQNARFVHPKTGNREMEYEPGLLGNYFANAMKPGADGKISLKMGAVKNHDPSNYSFDIEKVVPEFLQQQHQLLALLEKAQYVDLGKIRVPISLTRLIRLKLGDTFRFVVYHNERHLLQAQKVLMC